MKILQLNSISIRDRLSSCRQPDSDNGNRIMDDGCESSVFNHLDEYLSPTTKPFSLDKMRNLSCLRRICLTRSKHQMPSPEKGDWMWNEFTPRRTYGTIDESVFASTFCDPSNGVPIGGSRDRLRMSRRQGPRAGGPAGSDPHKNAISMIVTNCCYSTYNGTGV